MTTSAPVSPAGSSRAVGVEHSQVPARDRARRRAGDHRQLLDPHAVGRDRPAGLGLPPVVDHRHPELVLRPVQRVGVAPLAREKQGAQRRQVVFADQRALGILLADRAERGRRREQRDHAVLGDHAPERARVGGADRLALVQHGRAAVQQRRVDDVGVTDDPADVRRRPPDLARFDPVDVRHRPLQRHGVTAVVADDPLRLTRGARRVEDVERIGRGDRNAIGRLGLTHDADPVEVTLGIELRLQLRALQHDAVPWLVLGLFDRAVQQRLVVDQPSRLDPARGRDDHRRPRVVDPPGELVGGKAPEHDRMHRADPSAGEHRDRRLGDHRHVDDHAVAVLDAGGPQCSGELRDLIAQLAIGVPPDRVGHRRVVDQRRLIGAATGHVAIERVVTRVQLAACEPAVERGAAVVENELGRGDPVDRRRRFRPRTPPGRPAIA